jgi:hypothetical protein
MSDRTTYRRRRAIGLLTAAGLLLVGAAGCATVRASASPVTWSSPPAISDNATAIPSVMPSPPPSLTPSPSASPSPSPSPSHSPSPSPSRSPKPSHSPSPHPSTPKPSTSTASSTQCVKPVHGSYTVASGGSPVAGKAGHLYHYEVQVENGIGVTPAAFAAAVDATLANALGWTDSGKWEFQRVSGGTCDFVVELATAATSTQECAVYGLNTEGQTSCRGGKEVIINLTRWNTGDPDPAWDGHLDVYHDLVVNHEVGHFLGYGHMACPGPGKPLPVMATPITTGLQGCVINGFPYDASGTFLSGPPE